jgi:hypothetical protein
MTIPRRVIVEILLALLAALFVETFWPKGVSVDGEQRGHAIYVQIGIT